MSIIFNHTPPSPLSPPLSKLKQQKCEISTPPFLSTLSNSTIQYIIIIIIIIIFSSLLSPLKTDRGEERGG